MGFIGSGNWIVAQTSSQYGIAIGYYTDCDTAICADDAPAGFASGDYTDWAGFEGWESPAAIFSDTEADTPTHCAKCGRVIKHDLTPDGDTYVCDAIGEYIADPASHDTDTMAQWWAAYGDRFGASELCGIIANAFDELDLRSVIDHALEAGQAGHAPRVVECA